MAVKPGNAGMHWDALIAAAPKKPAGAAPVAQWVFDNIDVPANMIDRDTIPSTGAVGLLNWVRADEKNKGEFYKTIWSKTLPSKTEIDATSRFNDDGREVMSVIDRVAAAVGPASADLGTPKPSKLPSEVFGKGEDPPAPVERGPLPSDVFGKPEDPPLPAGPRPLPSEVFDGAGGGGGTPSSPRSTAADDVMSLAARSLGKRGR